MIVDLHGGPMAGQTIDLETTPAEVNVVIPDPLDAATYRDDVADVLARPPTYQVAIYRRSPWSETQYHYWGTVPGR